MPRRRNLGLEKITALADAVVFVGVLRSVLRSIFRLLERVNPLWVAGIVCLLTASISFEHLTQR
jgi:hypothetical protein